MANDKGKGGPPQDVLAHLYDVHSANGTLDKILHSGIGDLFGTTNQTSALQGYADPVGWEPWLFDGNELTLLADVYEGTQSSSPYGFSMIGGLLYFYGRDAAGEHLWSYDFESDALSMIDLGEDTVIRRTMTPEEVNGLIYFAAYSADDGDVLWAYDPQTQESEAVSSAQPGVWQGDNFVEVNDIIYYPALDQNGNSYELWSYDTLSETSQQITDYRSSSYINAAVGQGLGLIEFNDEIIFRARNYDEGLEYRAYNTQTGELRTLIDSNPGSGSSFGGLWMDYAIIGDTLFLPGGTPETGSEILAYNQVTGDIDIIDLNPGTIGSNAATANGGGMHVINGEIYLAATAVGAGLELWKINPDSFEATLLTNENGSNSGVYWNTAMYAYDDKLYYSVISEEFGHELGAYDTTTDELIIIDIVEGAGGSGAEVLGVVNDTIVIRARDLTGETNNLHMYAADGHPDSGDDFIHITDDSGTFRDPYNFTVFDLDYVA